jgi:hypothetical protein
MTGSRATRSVLATDRPTEGSGTVAMVVVLFPLCEQAPALQPTALEELARLGITNVCLLRDNETAGLVLEGWSFDPERGTDAALVAVGARDRLRTLQPLMQMVVSSAPIPGGLR